MTILKGLKIFLSIFGVLGGVFLSFLKAKSNQIKLLDKEAEEKRLLALEKMEISKNDLSSKIQKIDTNISFSDASRMLSNRKTKTKQVSNSKPSKAGKSRSARLSKDRQK
jgi:hypothetical protein